MDLPSKIRAARLLAGLDQRGLAFAMGMKSATHINRWEQGVSAPRSNMLQKLGDALRIYWPWLIDSNLPYTQEEIHFLSSTLAICRIHRPLAFAHAQTS